MGMQSLSRESDSDLAIVSGATLRANAGRLELPKCGRSVTIDQLLVIHPYFRPIRRELS
jgi:hypothetical protein